MAPRVHAAPAPTPTRAIPPSMVGVTGFLVNALAERLREVTSARLGSAGIRPRQIGLLLVLRDQGRTQQQLLGEGLGMDRTTTMQLVAALEAQGMVVREADPADGRAYLLRLSARGARLADQVERQAREAAAEVLTALSPAESRTFHRLLVKVLAAQPAVH